MNHGFTGCLRSAHRRTTTSWIRNGLKYPARRKSRQTIVSRICLRSISHSPGDKAENEDQAKNPSIWTQLQSPPNLITLTRIASTPLLAYWIVEGEYQLAMYGVVIASISDSADGYLAKHYNMATVVGSYLDPIADKVLVNVLGISLWYSGVLPTPLVALWASKDALLLSGTAYNIYQRHKSINFFSTAASEKTLVVTPTFLGKASTFFQFTTLALGISTPVMGLAPWILDGSW